MKRILFLFASLLAFATPALASYQGEVLSKNPLFLYLFDESVAATTLIDHSPNNVDGTVVGAVTFGETGTLPGRTCALFAGGKITIPSPIGISGGQARTVEFLVHRRTSAREIVFAQGDAGTGVWRQNLIVYMNVQNAGELYVAFNGRDVYKGTLIPQFEWHHVTVCYDGGAIGTGTVRMYLDGVLVTGTAVAGPDAGAAITLDNNAQIGDSVADSTTPRLLASNLAALAVYDYALTGTQVTENYNAWVAATGDVEAGALTVTDRGATTVDFAYGEVVGGTEPYSNQLQRSLTSGSGFTNRGSPVVGATATFGDTGLTAGTTYYYRVATTDAGAIVDYSPEVIVYVGTALQQAYLNGGFYSSFHYGMYSAGGPYSPDGTENPNLFQPIGNLNLDQWFDAVQAAGITGVMLTTKHHDGFALWPSASQPHNITAGTWYAADPTNRNILLNFCTKARARGLRVELYFSIRDKKWEIDNPGFTSAAYTSFVTTQMTELLGGTFGTIDTITFDGWGWDVGHANVVLATVFAHIRSLQPNIVICENDHAHSLSTSDIAMYEHNIDAPPAASNAIPAEFWAPIRYTPPRWTVSTPDSESVRLTAGEIISMRDQNNARNATFRLNPTPGQTGVVPTSEVTILRAVGGLTTPPPVQRARVVRTTSTTATIQWDAPSTIPLGYRFRIYQSTSEDSGFVQVQEKFKYENAHSGLVITGLTPGTHYYFRISVRDFADNVSERAMNIPYYPAPATVGSGVDYGPTGTEFEGTLTGGGSGGGINGSAILGMP